MLTRRRLLALTAGGIGVAAAGCAGSKAPATIPGADDERSETPTGSEDAPTATAAVPTTVVTEVPAAGTMQRALLEGSPYETPAVITHSGVAGPVLVVLGGVHGNEPGGRLAAEDVAAWAPASGSLAVVPRANVVAIERWERTSDDLGDLNRLYPGVADSAVPMERMAAAIVALCRELGAAVLLDLHESWAFYVERAQDGPAFIGQTLTSGVGPRSPALGRAVIERVNSQITVERDLLVARDGSAFRAPDGSPVSGIASRGRSSLSLGAHVPGLTPILAEMGQEDQPLERRVEIHLAIVRAAMDELSM